MNLQIFSRFQGFGEMKSKFQEQGYRKLLGYLERGRVYIEKEQIRGKFQMIKELDCLDKIYLCENYIVCLK